MRSLLASLLCSISLLSPAQPRPDQTGGVIRGQVTDVLGAVIPRATVRVLDVKTRQTIQTPRLDPDARFEVPGLAPGDCLLAISAPGFAEKLLVAAPPGNASSRFLTIRLKPMDCDAPGVNCDVFTDQPVAYDPQPVFTGDRTFRLSDSLDLEKGLVSPSKPGAGDLILSAHAGGLYLVPLNKASISSHCTEKPLLTTISGNRPSIRVDGLGKNSEICVRANHGSHAKIFLTREVQPGADQISIHIVTRAR